MQRVIGGQALTETAAAESAPPSIYRKGSRCAAGNRQWPRGAIGYLPQGHFEKTRPVPSTSAVPLTCARGFGHRIKRNSLAADAKVMGGKALTETGRRRIRAAVDLSKWISMRRRQTGGGGLTWPRGATGYLPQ